MATRLSNKRDYELKTRYAAGPLHADLDAAIADG